MSEKKLEGVLRRRRLRKYALMLATAALLLAGLVCLWLWLETSPQPSTKAPTKGAAPATHDPSPALPRDQSGTAASPSSDLHPGATGRQTSLIPELDLSDAFVREAVSTLSRNPEVARWLMNDDLIRRFVAAVDNVAEGGSPRKHLAFLAPEAPFQIVGDDVESDPVLVDPRTYARYDSIAGAVDAVDAAGCARLFAMLLPLMQQAYVELGYPELRFEARFKEAAYELLSAPVPTGPVRLIPHVRRFEYEDAALEDLTDAQKHLLRMGPDNAARVQRKIRAIVLAVDPAWKPPAARVYQPDAHRQAD